MTAIENNPSGYSALIINSSHFQEVSSHLPLTFISTGLAARSVLMDASKRFAAIFIDPTVSNPGGTRLIALAHKYRPATPIYLLYDNEEPFNPEMCARMGIQGSVKTPLSSTKVKKLIAHEIFDYYFDPTQEPTHEKSDEDHQYLAVTTTDFLSSTPSTFDVYVRLPSGKYFKILSAKDSFTPDRVLAYLSKGVTHFYIKRTSHEACLTYCDTLSEFLLSQSGVSFEMKVAESFIKGQDALELIRSQQFGPIHLEYLQIYLNQLRQLIAQMNLGEHRQVRAFLNNMAAYDRAVSCTMITGLLGLPLKIQSEQSFRTVGLATLLHDIGLYKLPTELQKGDEALMNVEQRKIYQTHPKLGADILSTFPGIDEVVIQAVAQHHERRNRKGFPGTTPPDQINRIAEMIGISDEFVNLIIRSKDDISLNPIQYMVQNIFDGFSYPIIESFRTLFIGNEERTPSVQS